MGGSSAADVVEGASSGIEPPEGAEVVRTKGCRLWLDRGVVCQVFEVSRVEREHVVDITAAVERMVGATGKGKLPVLLDLRAVRWASADSRSYGALETTRSPIAAVAVIVASPVTRMVATVFIRLSRPAFPMRIFTNVAEARAWLEAYVLGATSDG